MWSNSGVYPGILVRNTASVLTEVTSGAYYIRVSVIGCWIILFWSCSIKAVMDKQERVYWPKKYGKIWLDIVMHWLLISKIFLNLIDIIYASLCSEAGTAIVKVRDCFNKFVFPLVINVGLCFILYLKILRYFTLYLWSCDGFYPLCYSVKTGMVDQFVWFTVYFAIFKPIFEST
jgi:hypothetical protein